MSKVNSLLSKRLEKKSNSGKVTVLSRESASGKLSSFSGLFPSCDLTEGEKGQLENLLLKFSEDEHDISEDLETLFSITSEVKAINNQAAMLHGERIKRAQALLKSYEEGAFTGWLLATYGNRQTPYNFLHYYDFHQQIQQKLRPQLERMPRQVVYTLASRQGPLDKKEELIQAYSGETKAEMLERIRELFPLEEKDLRRTSVGDQVVKQLADLYAKLSRPQLRLNKKQKKSIEQLLDALYTKLEEC